MKNYTKEELTAKIKNLKLEPDQEEFLIKKIEAAPEMTDEVVSSIREEIQKMIDGAFDAMGVTLDENDPEYQAEHQKMLTKIEAAENEFNAEMTALEKEADDLTKESSNQMDNLQMKAVQNQINAV